MKAHIKSAYICMTVATLLSCIPFIASAQGKKYALEVTAGKKIINVPELDVPSTTSLKTILTMYPELLVSRGSDPLENYNLMINNVTAGNAKEALLENITAADIKKIELLSTPETAPQKNSQTGTVKVFLKDLKDGISGKAMVAVSTAFNLAPMATFNYKKGAIEFRSSLTLQKYIPSNASSIRETNNDEFTKYVYDTTKRESGYQLLNLDLVYAPSPKHNLHVWFTESSSTGASRKSLATEVNSVRSTGTDKEITSSFSYLAGAKYKFTLPNMIFESEITTQGKPTAYSRNKISAEYEKLNSLNFKSQEGGNILTGMMKYTYKFVPETSTQRINLAAGVNVKYSPLYYNYVTNGVSNINCSSNTLYLSPYIESNNVFGDVYLKGTLRLQHYETKTSVYNLDKYFTPGNHVVAIINVGYQIAPHHHISATFDRNVRHWDDAQVYPVPIYSPFKDKYYVGNPDLRAASIHDATVEYITDFESGPHSFIFNTSLKYVNTKRMICEDIYEDYITYNNNGSSNVGIWNLSFIYKYNILTLAFTGNFFANSSVISNKKTNYKYFNLSLQPTLNLKDGWSVNGQFTYNSKVRTHNSSLSDCLFVNARLQKDWNKWTGFLELSDCMHQTAEDRIFGTAVSETLKYSLNQPAISLGGIFRF